MGDNTMKATGRDRLVRHAATIVGLVAAIMLTFAVQANRADAAVVGNPGTFTATWNSGGSLNYGNRSFPTSGSFTMNVNANGTFTASGITFPGQSAPDVVNGNVQLQQVTLTPQATGSWSGTIDPRPGANSMSLSGNMQIGLYSNRSGYIGVVTNTANTTCTGSTAVNVNPSGSNYNFSTGTVSLNFGPFTGGGASGCNARSGVIGGSTANQDGPVNSAYGMNGSGNTISTGLTISPPILPPNIVPALEATPSIAATDQTVTLDAGDSFIRPGSGVQACASPSPSEPNCGYRWDFDNDGNVDEVTNSPSTTHVFGADGVYHPKVTIFDTSGLSYDATTPVTTQTRPVAQIDTNPASVTKETDNVFTFSIPTNPYSATTECSVDGAAFTDCDSGDTFTFSQTDDTSGSHQFRVRGITPGGVTGPAASYSFTIDRVKPRVTVNPASQPANPTNVTTANFSFTADKPGSTLECQLDGGAWVACGTNSTGTQQYNGLNENPNPHQFRVRATDPLGNIGGGGNPGGGGYDWRVDLTAPVPTFVDKPANPSNVVSPLITWSSDEPVQLAQCRLKVDGVTGPWAACDSLTSKQYTDLADDNYEFSIRVLDIAGNWSNILAHQWLLETVSPNLEITSGPPALSNRSLAQFFYDYEPGASLTCQLDSRPVQDPCPSGIKYAYIAEGSHLFTVTATDAALNSTTKTYTWSSKTIQPVVQINAGSVPASSSTVNTADFELATANGDAECRIDGSDWEACDSDEGQSYTDLADGNHTFEVRAVDTYGNVSPIDAYSWLVATAAPEVTFTSTPLENTRESTAFFGFDVTSADADVIAECSLDGTEPFVCSDETALVNLEDGDHNFTVTATDTAGIQGVASFDWNVKAKIPGLGFDSVPSSLSDSADATFEFSSDEDPDVAYDCKLDGGSWDSCASPVSKSGLGQGSHSFSIRATDSVGNTAVETYDWKVDTVAPSVTFGSKPAASTVDIAELISFSASETGVTYECSFDNAAFAACTSPALLRNLSAGAHSFRVKATDEAGNEGAVATASWTRGLPAPPSVTAAPAAITGVTAKVGSGALSGSAPLSKATKAKTKKKAKKAAKKNAKKASKNVKKAKGKR